MGWTTQIKGNNHIVFHVGKYLPQEGESVMLVPGKQNAQGRGVYCSEEVQVKYTGGEYYKQALDIVPVYCIPLHGRWTKGKLRKDNNKIVYCSFDEYKGPQVIDLKNLSYTEAEQAGIKLRYYFPTDVSFYTEPKEKVYDLFAQMVREGKLPYEKALMELQEVSPEDHVESEILNASYSEAFNQNRIPELPQFLRETEIYHEMRR